MDLLDNIIVMLGILFDPEVSNTTKFIIQGSIAVIVIGSAVFIRFRYQTAIWLKLRFTCLLACGLALFGLSIRVIEIIGGNK